jgi:dTDP-4-amino-4,6-dideoxygalactose transaminase
MLRDHGQAKKYYHDMEGYNGRLDAIQAGLLQVKLPHLSAWNSLRRERAADYKRLLADNEAVSLPYEPSWSRAVYHLYVIRSKDREGLISHLKEAGISTGIHYPIPLHLQKAYVSLKYERGAFPVAERVAAEIVSLPMFPQLSAMQQSRVVEEVTAFSSNGLLETGGRGELKIRQLA